MSDRGYLFLLAGSTLLLAGCAVESNELKVLKEQVRIQQKQIVDLRTRQEEHQAKLEILDNSFKILGEKAEDNDRRLQEMEAGGAAAPQAPAVISAPVTVPSPAPQRPPSALAPPSAPPPALVPAAPPAPRAPAPEPGPPAAPRASAPLPAEAAPVSPALTAAELYRSALDNFTKENYGRAILEFEEFVANHPDNDLADNAQYWIGECYYAQKNFQMAVAAFDKVEVHFGGGNKVTAALLKKGLAQKELGLDAEAMATLERVVARFPQSDEASIAQRKLSQWR